MRRFYISDLHFGHKNILTYDNRPYFSVSEMDENLINNWNNVVDKDDFVYILGDVSWYGKLKEDEILNRLNGDKILIRGNHDDNTTSSYYFQVADYMEVKDGDKKVVLSHYPILSFNGMHHGAIHLYGHVHRLPEWNMANHHYAELSELYGRPIMAANVGCMMEYMDYTPRTLKEIEVALGW